MNNALNEALEKKKDKNYNRGVFSEGMGKDYDMHINRVGRKHQGKFLKGVAKATLSELNPIKGIKEIISVKSGHGLLPKTKNERRSDAMKIGI